MTDIVFDYNEQLTALCNTFKIQGSDLLLDSSARRHLNGPSYRRALVHDQNDGLTVNFANDYPGGVTINGVKALDVVGDLQFRIFNQTEIITHGVDPRNWEVVQATTETVKLSDIIKTLRREIADLQTQVARLGQRP
jgi:hypothetical protein